MSIGASATLERNSAVVHYLDVILLVILAAPLIALGVPALGYGIGGGSWSVGRFATTAVERRIAEMVEFRRQIGYGVAISMLRVWILAGMIVLAGVAGSRADGLTAALVIFGAFSLYFVRSAIGQWTRRRSTTA